MIPTIAFFNNKGGVGKTSLVYHMAWMYADMGHAVLAVDLDPQANLTTAMVDQERLQVLWDQGDDDTLYGAISPLMRGLGDISEPHRERIGDKLELIVGDLAISKFEDELASQWARCMDRQERAFRVITAFHRCIQAAASTAGADIVLIDLGPNLGAINRAALVASHHIVVPVAPDLFSLQGLKNLGPTVRQWHEEWKERLPKNPVSSLHLTNQVMQPAGYVVLQHSVRMDRPMQAYDLWMNRIPEAYATYVLDEPAQAKHPSKDRHCLGLLKRYGSLMPMAQEARKPIFHLKPADGALGAHAAAARDARNDFKRVAERIAQATWLPKKRP
ncbi:MAG TPA: AAA family ATPase [Kofleriaceae bacterium]|nr:AAA family ATPase [Kofleriaceae bacterium]